MTNTQAPLIDMENISIAFGGIRAVDGASINLFPGEVVALLGHNGAGKSTLIKILSGAYKRDSGTIKVNGEEAAISNPRDAKAYGIETIYQTLALADNVDTAANLYLGRELMTPWGTLDDVAMEHSAREVMGQTQSTIPTLQGPGQGALWRSAPVRGHRPGDPLQRTHSDHGRAHGRTWATGNGAGWRADQAA